MPTAHQPTNHKPTAHRPPATFPCLCQVRHINTVAMDPVRRRAERIRKELALSPSLSIMATLAHANKALGISQVGPLASQFDRLYKVMGLLN